MIKKLKRLYADNIDPDSIQPLQAVRTLIACILAVIVYHSLPWQQSYWVLFSTVLLIQTYLGKFFKQKIKMLILTGLSVTVLTYIASLVGHNTFILALFLGFSTFITLCFYRISFDAGSAAFFVNVFCLCAGALPVNTTESLHRAICVFIGTFISVFTCIIFFPDTRTRLIKKNIESNIARLKDYQCVLATRPHDRRAVMFRRNRLIRGLQNARHIIPKNEKQALDIIQKIQDGYDRTLMDVYT